MKSFAIAAITVTALLPLSHVFAQNCPLLKSGFDNYSSVEGYTATQADFDSIGPRKACTKWSAKGINVSEPALLQCDYVIKYCGNFVDGIDHSSAMAQVLTNLMVKYQYVFADIDKTKEQSVSCKFKPNNVNYKYRCKINFSVKSG